MVCLVRIGPFAFGGSWPLQLNLEDTLYGILGRGRCRGDGVFGCLNGPLPEDLNLEEAIGSLITGSRDHTTEVHGPNTFVYNCEVWRVSTTSTQGSYQ